MKTAETIFIFLLMTGVQACTQHTNVEAEFEPEVVRPKAAKLEHIFVPNEKRQVIKSSKPPTSGPLQVADASDVDVNMMFSGRWLRTETDWVWELEVEAETASNLNFGFKNVKLSEHAQLVILNSKGEVEGGRYSAKQNKPHGELWTGTVTGRVALIRLTMPHEERNQNTLTLKKINRGR